MKGPLSKRVRIIHVVFKNIWWKNDNKINKKTLKAVVKGSMKRLTTVQTKTTHCFTTKGQKYVFKSRLPRSFSQPELSTAASPPVPLVGIQHQVQPANAYIPQHKTENLSLSNTSKSMIQLDNMQIRSRNTSMAADAEHKRNTLSHFGNYVKAGTKKHKTSIVKRRSMFSIATSNKKKYGNSYIEFSSSLDTFVQ